MADTTTEDADAVRAAVGALDLDAKARLLAGQDMWSLPALPEIGLAPVVMSDGPIGVRGVRWSADDPSIALPSPTALAATWDVGLARRVGRLLAQEARRKGVHVLLAPTVNLHRTPLGGRHFEAYSEDPRLTAEIGAGYVAGVQDGGVAATPKHFVANEAETARLTVDNLVDQRTLRELYLAPFEAIVRRARPWALMSAYNGVNGSTMTEHGPLQRGVLRGEWGFDGCLVSDWTAARDTVRALTGGLDVAMPGPDTVYGPALAAAVRDGRVPEADVDEAVRRVLLLAARVGAWGGAGPAVAAADRPAEVAGRALAREVAGRSFVLLRNEGGVLPLRPVAPGRTPDAGRGPGGAGAARGPGATGAGGAGHAGARQDVRVRDAGVRDAGAGVAGAWRRAVGAERGPGAAEPAVPGAGGVALLGAAAWDARVFGGGSAQVFPEHVVSPLEGLRAALPDGVPLRYAVGAAPSDELAVAGAGFALRAVVRDGAGRVLGEQRLPNGEALWLGDFPGEATFETAHTVQTVGTFTPRESGAHAFGTRGLGGFRLVVGGEVLFEGEQAPAAYGPDAEEDPTEAFFGTPIERGRLELTADEPVEVSLTCTVAKPADLPVPAIGFALVHRPPEREPEELLAEAVAAAAAADTAVVVVATTERVESEGFDRADLRLPGRQDELVRRVAATGTPTVVVVNAGAPVEMDWREDVAAVLLAWFPGQEAGAALADVLLGAAEPAGRLPTTWPARLADAPVTRVRPEGGRLAYDEGLYVGYRAWQRRLAEGVGAPPAYWFGHGLGYTDWDYLDLRLDVPEGAAVARQAGPAARTGAAVRADDAGAGHRDRAGRDAASGAGYDAGCGAAVRTSPEGRAGRVEGTGRDSGAARGGRAAREDGAGRPDGAARGDGAAHDSGAAPGSDGYPGSDPGAVAVATAVVRVRNTGDRPGREVVQVYLAPSADPGRAGRPAAPGGPAAPERPACWLAGFTVVEAGPGETVEAVVPLERRAFEVWREPTTRGPAPEAAAKGSAPEAAGGWDLVPGGYAVRAGRSVADLRVAERLEIARPPRAGAPG